MAEHALIAKKLGRYDITRVLGKGAMGVVYEAIDPNLNRKVAIKTVRVDSLSKDEAADYELRFRTEAHSAARLQHPNIVSVYDSDRDGDTPFLVMEYIQGEDLKHYLDKGKRFTLEQSVRMMSDLLAALAYAHQSKIIHRDIKPANLLIEANGRVKLTDFGVARIQDSGEATRTQGGIVGTLKYMSPEQVEGRSVDAASDMFSAGIVLYQLLTDRRPFDGDSYFAIVKQITTENAPAPSNINPMLPPALDAVLARALAKDKNQRFATALDFSQALQLAAQQADPTITPSANPYKIIEPHSTGAMERSGSSTSNTLSHTNSAVTQELELVYWKDVKDSDDPQDLTGFINRFPEGVYADLAKRRLKRIAETKEAQGQALYETTQITAPPGTSPAAEPLPISITMQDPPRRKAGWMVYGAVVLGVAGLSVAVWEWIETKSESPPAVVTSAQTTATITNTVTALASGPEIITPTIADIAVPGTPSASTSSTLSATAALPVTTGKRLVSPTGISTKAPPRVPETNIRATGLSSVPSSQASSPPTHSSDSPRLPAVAIAPSAAPNAPDKPVFGPKEACEGRVLFGYGACLITECARPSFKNHPICVERHKQDEQRKEQAAMR